MHSVRGQLYRSMATLAELATHCGLSKSTISRALRDHPEIAKETCARVQAAAAEIGYHTDPLRSMAGERMRRARLAPLVVVTKEPMPRGHMRLKVQLERQAMQRGFEVHALSLEAHNNDAVALCAAIMALEPAAVALANGLTSYDLDLPYDRLAVIGLSTAYRFDALPRVTFDLTALMIRAWHQAKALGWKRIGWCTFSHTPASEACMVRLGLVDQFNKVDGNTIPAFDGFFTDAAAVRAWVSEHRPDGVISLHNGAWWWLREDPALANIPMFSLQLDERHIGLCAGYLVPSAEIASCTYSEIERLIQERRQSTPTKPRVTLVVPEWSPAPGIG